MIDSGWPAVSANNMNAASTPDGSTLAVPECQRWRSGAGVGGPALTLVVPE
jgi:hypothetical protein